MLISKTKHFFLYQAITRFILCFVAVSAIPLLLFSQEDFNVRVSNFNNKDGLAHNMVHTLYPDDEGIVWIRIRGEIASYNGSAIASHQKANINQGINEIVEDKEGRLWFYNKLKKMIHRPLEISLFDKKIKKLIEIKDYPFLPEDIIDIKPKKDKGLYFYTKQNTVIDFSSREDYKIIKLEDNYQPIYYFWVKEIDNEFFFTKIKRDGQQVTYNNEGQIIESKKWERNRINLEYFPNKYWLANTPLKKDTSLTSFLLNQKELNPPIDLEDDQGFVVFYDQIRELFWYTKNKKLIGFHPVNGIQYELSLGNFVGYLNVSDMIFKEQTIWISTTNNGFYQVQFQPNIFKNYREQNFLHTRRIIKDKIGNVWFANNKGLNILDSNLNLIKTDTSGYFLSVIKDASSNIWSINGKELIKFDESQIVKESYETPNDNKNNKYIFTWCLAEDLSGNIWFANDGYLYYFDIAKKIKKFDRYNEFASIKKSIIYEIKDRDKDHLWVCSSEGLYLLNKEHGLIERYWEGGKGKYFLPARKYHNIFIDKDQVHWLATGDNGLIKWKPNFASKDAQNYWIENFNIFNGMPSNIMHGIFEDNNGYLWISSENGIIQFNKKNHYFRVFQEEDGIDHNEFNRISHYQDDQGNIYFGSTKGITIFHPDDFIIDSIPSPISILSLKKYKDDRYENYLEEYHKTETVEFENAMDHFVLKFGSINPLDKISHNYFFAFDQTNNWIPANDNSITLNNLSFGSHQLNIQKENIAGQQVGLLQMTIIVPYPFYLQSWFLISLFAGFLFLLYLINKWRIHAYKQRQIELETIVKKRTKKIEEQTTFLKHVNETKSQFFNSIAHELRNPLTLIMGSAKMIEENITNNNDRNESFKYINSVHTNSKKMLKLTEEVLTLSKLEAQPEKLYESPISLHLLMKNILKAFESAADFQKKQLVFQYNLDENILVSLDVSKFEKIINNLISNAFKYSPNYTTINLTLDRKGEDNLQVRVEDNGYGIHPDDLPHVFKPYFRSQNNKTHDPLDAKSGIGIGLALVKRLTEILKGEITIESELNKGTTVSLLFPLKILDAANLQNVVDDNFDFNHLSKENINIPNSTIDHILIVEDHKEIQQFIQGLLETRYQISLATNGKEALNLLSLNYNNSESPPISLIISDVMMPEMDGLNFLEKIKTHELWRQLPFLFLTGYSNEDFQLKAMRLGVEDYLKKPFEPQELVSRVQYLLDNKYQRDFIDKEEKTISNSSEENKWLQALKEVVNKNISNPLLDVEFLASELTIGKRQLNRRVKLLTGLTPAKFILEIRLQEARRLLENREYSSVTAVCYSVGFKTLNHFSKRFKLRFGRRPSSYFE